MKDEEVKTKKARILHQTPVMFPHWESMSNDEIFRKLRRSISVRDEVEKSLAGIILGRANMTDDQRVKVGMMLMRTVLAVMPKHMTSL